MSVLLSGGTGFLGGYVLSDILLHSDDDVELLVRAKSETQALDKLWKGLQLHLNPEQFYSFIPRIRFVFGDVSETNLGINAGDYTALLGRVTSVLHIAASLNRRSEKICMNVNLKGTLGMIELAMKLEAQGGLRRFSYVSTVAVAGKRQSENIKEPDALRWDLSDYDPYARTKKFCEHMVRELLPPKKILILRPSIVMGDSRFGQTTQFDMVRAFSSLLEFPVLPMARQSRLDIVNADFVGRAIARLHRKDELKYDCYHLSSGKDATTADQIARVMAEALNRTPPRFIPHLARAFSRSIDATIALPRQTSMYRMGMLLKVFWPYITFDTVFENDRVIEELHERPTSFLQYAPQLYRFARENGFAYPFETRPEPAERVSKTQGSDYASV